MEIVTERLLIRPWLESDAGLMKAMARDMGYNCFTTPGRFAVENDEHALSRVREWILGFEQTGISKMPVFIRETNEFIGTCGFGPAQIFNEPQIELAYRLLIDHWGKGYATEAARAMVNHAFTDLKREQVFAFIHPHNKASREVIIRLGFKKKGRHLHNGLDYDLYFRVADYS